MPVTIETIRPQEIDASLRDAWCRLLAEQPQFASPFFHPAYAQQLAEVRPQVEVAVLNDGGRPVGFFPYERHKGNVARPLGIRLADFQGVVAAPDVEWSAAELLRGARLSLWHFDHLLPASKTFAPYVLESAPSPYLDLSAGYDEYVTERRKAGTAQITQSGRKRRKLQRERGTVEFRWHDPDDEAFEKLLEWKAAQRARTKTLDILQWDWVRTFLRELRNHEEPGFRGLMSTIRVEGELAAVHLGLATDRTFHYWFPTYDAAFYRYSPGVILLLEMARECAERGITRFDLGKGNDDYKNSFASAATEVATGAVDPAPLRRAARSGWHHLQAWIKQSPLKETARVPKRLIKRLQARISMGAAT
ncbi:hypothetical protein Mal4_44750 [Maioricimonas rarisocia]|uniref:BioF2-like acetyltransferase domain-containing protein n=1 Tax=Maioricimonas rarisocia TaxID=2528026 RepID=A0A517ZCF3_9PLAN|nr:GNAT family N-acetyltransferase [Maioricimonas rarisocia]QDU40120.1 hypothetical protein Mal4_44750 [Maioricimonas rarisocia]